MAPGGLRGILGTGAGGPSLVVFVAAGRGGISGACSGPGGWGAGRTCVCVCVCVCVCDSVCV